MTVINEAHGYVRALKEERAGLVTRMREKLDRAKTENRQLEGDERAGIDRIETDIRDLDERINDFEGRIALERANGEARAPWADIVRPTIETTSAHGDANANLRAIFRAGEEFEVRSNLNTVTTTAGGYTVPTTLYPIIREYLVAMSAAWQLNAFRLPTSSGEPMDIPVNNSTGTAAIVGEGTAIASSDPTFTKVTLHSYKYGRLLQVTNELLADNAVDFQNFIGKESARALSNGYGDNFVHGSGSNQPQGYMNGITMGGTSIAGGTGQPSYNDLVTVVYSVPMQYRQVGCQWVMADSAVASARKLVDLQNRPIWEPSTQAGQPDALMGYPIVTDPFMTALGTAAGTSIAFGDWSGWYLRDIGIRFDVSRDFAFDKDITTYRVIQRLDSKWADNNGVRGLKSPTT